MWGKRPRTVNEPRVYIQISLLMLLFQDKKLRHACCHMAVFCLIRLKYEIRKELSEQKVVRC
jgi:hypothetical protein